MWHCTPYVKLVLQNAANYCQYRWDIRNYIEVENWGGLGKWGEGCWCTLSILPPRTHRNRPMLHTQPHSALQKQYDYVLLEHIDSGFPIKDARLLKYEKSISSIILPSFSLLIRSGLSFSFEKQAPFLGNSVDRLEPHR